MIGSRVRVVVPEGCTDPWIKPKDGWEGVVVAAIAGMDDHFAVRFLPPWCSLKITRAMPGAALRKVKVVTTITQRKLPMC
jgi:hypothetical protein